MIVSQLQARFTYTENITRLNASQQAPDVTFAAQVANCQPGANPGDIRKMNVLFLGSLVFNYKQTGLAVE